MPKILPRNPVKPKARSFERVCVLAGRMDFQPSPDGCPCASRIHGHMTGAKAAQLVATITPNG